MPKKNKDRIEMPDFEKIELARKTVIRLLEKFQLNYREGVILLHYLHNDIQEIAEKSQKLKEKEE